MLINFYLPETLLSLYCDSEMYNKMFVALRTRRPRSFLSIVPKIDRTLRISF